MRVTTTTFPDALVNQLSSLASRQNRLQKQAATGQLIEHPSDDPAAMRRALDLQSEGRAVSQYQRNIERQQELASATYDSLKAFKKISDRATEIATLSDGLKSPAELQSYAAELNEMIKQAVELANAKNRGDYIFGGTQSDQPAFTMATDANGVVTGVSYNGNTASPETEVGENVTVSVHVPGANNTGSGPRGMLQDSRSGADFFSHLISLHQNLVAGDTAAIANTNKAQLSADEENFIYQIGTNGAVQSRLETTAATLVTRGATLEGQVSNETDADLAQTLVRLSQTQNAYQAALQSAGSILNMSLMDYLR